MNTILNRTPEPKILQQNSALG